MTQSLEVGTHVARRAGDLLELRVRGPLTASDVEALHRAVRSTVEAAGRCYLLADLGEMAGLDPEARRQMAAWGREREDEVDGVAAFGCSFAMRTLITLTLNAIKILRRKQSETVFVRDEAAARRWIEARRAAVATR